MAKGWLSNHLASKKQGPPAVCLTVTTLYHVLDLDGPEAVVH